MVAAFVAPSTLAAAKADSALRGRSDERVYGTCVRSATRKSANGVAVVNGDLLLAESERRQQQTVEAGTLGLLGSLTDQHHVRLWSVGRGGRRDPGGVERTQDVALLARGDAEPGSRLLPTGVTHPEG